MSKGLSLYKKYRKSSTTYYDYTKHFIAESENGQIPKVKKIANKQESKKIMELREKAKKAEKRWEEVR